MTLWRVLDYTRATLRVAVKHPPNKLTELGQKGQLKAEPSVGEDKGIRPP